MKLSFQRMLSTLLILACGILPFQSTFAEDNYTNIIIPNKAIDSYIPPHELTLPMEAMATLKAISVTGSVYESEWKKNAMKRDGILAMRKFTYTQKDLEDLILQGATEEDIYASDMLGNEWAIPPRDLIENNKKFNKSWSEQEQQLKETKGNSIKTTNSQLFSLSDLSTSSVTEGTYEGVESSVLDSAYGTSLVRPLAANFANEIYGIYNGLIAQMQINQTKKPQFSDLNGSSEMIDPASGKMSWKHTDISLPGKDGLDLNIGVMFDSNNAFPYMKYYSGFNDLKKYNYLISRYDLGMGWSFMFPSIQIADGGYMYYHQGDGQVYRIDMNATDALGSYTHLLGYEGKDERIVLDNQGLYSNGQATSAFYLEYADKKREYFAADGRLLGIVDRFANAIKFQYTDRQLYDGLSYKVISSITDTVGRVVSFNYDSNLQTASDSNFSGEGITITVKDPSGVLSQQVVYMKSRASLELNGQSDGYVPALWYIQNQANEKIGFGYITDAYTDFDFIRKHSTSPYSGRNFSTLLGRVQYPRSVTWYDYEKHQVNLGDSGFTDEYRVLSRKDTLIKFDATRNQYTFSKTDQGYNQMNYSYSGDYTGYIDNNGIPATYTYSSSSTVQSGSSIGGLTTTTAFNQNGQTLSISTRASNGEKKIIENQSFDTIYKTKPTQIVLSDYAAENDNAPNVMFKENRYSDWGGLLSETTPLTSAQFNNASVKNKYTTAYTYDPTYYFIKTKSSYQNESDTTPLVEQYEYYSDGRLKSFTNANHEMTSYCYSVKDTNGNIRTNCTDPMTTLSGKLTAVKETKELGNGQQMVTATDYLSESNYAYPEQITSTITNRNKSGQVVNTQIIQKKMTYYLGTGQLRTETDGDGNVTLYTYDSMGRIIKMTYPSFSNLNNVIYDISDEYSYVYSNTPSNTDSQNAGILCLAVSTNRKYTQRSTGEVTILSNKISYYDGLGFLIYDLQSSTSGQNQITQSRKDDLGRAVYSLDPVGNTITLSYDAWGNQKEAIDSYGNLYVTDHILKSRQEIHYFVSASDVSTYRSNPSLNAIKSNYVEQDYDQWGQLLTNRVYKNWPSKNNPLTEQYSYNLRGNIVAYIDPKRNLNGLGVTTKFSYDALNRLTEVKDALNQITKYQYDVNGQVVKATMQSNDSGTPVTLYTKTYNELGKIYLDTDPNGNQTLYGYNNLGLLQQKNDPNGSSFTYQYDKQSRLSTLTTTGVTGITQQTKSNIGSNGILFDTLETYKNGTRVSSFVTQMDSLKRIISLQVIGANSFAARLELSYDASNRVTSLISSNGSTESFNTNYQYIKSRLNKVQIDGQSIINNADSANVKYEYFPNGLVKTITYPSQIVTEYTYDSLHRVSTVKNKKGSDELSSVSYLYDDNGNVISFVQKMIKQPLRKDSYTYDKLNRLESITRIDGTSIIYTYDLQGNRHTLSRGISNSSYDSSYQFDLDNKLVSFTKGTSTTTFDYAADGMRYKKTTGSKVTQYRYNTDKQVVAEVDGNNHTIANYVRGDRLLVKRDMIANRDYYYLYNGHGDVIQIVDASGNVVNSYNYDEWGNITRQVEGTPNVFKYAGELFDDETGLYYLRARYYDPSDGRFINEDTYEGQIDNPLTLNLYTYVHNNPLTNIDPTGHYCASVDGKIGHYGTCTSSTSRYMSDSDVNAILQASGGRANLNSIVSGSGIKWSEVKTSLDSILQTVASRAPSADTVAAMAGFTTDYGSEVVRRAITPFYSEVGSISGYSLNPVASKPYSALGIVSKVTTAGLLSVDLYGVVTDSTLSTGQKVGKAAIIATGTYISYKIGSEVVWLSTTIGGPSGFAAGIIVSGGIGYGISKLQAIAIQKLVM